MAPFEGYTVGTMKFNGTIGGHGVRLEGTVEVQIPSLD